MNTAYDPPEISADDVDPLVEEEADPFLGEGAYGDSGRTIAEPPVANSVIPGTPLDENSEELTDAGSNGTPAVAPEATPSPLPTPETKIKAEKKPKAGKKAPPDGKPKTKYKIEVVPEPAEIEQWADRDRDKSSALDHLDDLLEGLGVLDRIHHIAHRVPPKGGGVEV